MAGYVMTLDSQESLIECINRGIYSTNLSSPTTSGWITHHEGTFADYLSMKENDSIYFFIKRKIYGIGKLVNIAGDCKHLNYIDADEPSMLSEEEFKNNSPLIEDGTIANRVLCTFKPNPFFFNQSVDMDEALNSNPDKFRMLRAMWKVSFIKIDDEEDKALQDVILKKNEEEIYNPQNIYSFDDSFHKLIERKIKIRHRMRAYNILKSASASTKIKHEMAIEAVLCEMLNKEDSIFGKWDYISHQVVASPFKPIDYMDKMDIFGYRYIKGYDTISKYLVIEIKKDEASLDVINQIMKYVDWINQEYTHGDYSMIEAYVLAYDYSDEVIEKRNRECKRLFTKGYRPTNTCEWNNCKLVKYRYEDGQLEFEEV